MRRNTSINNINFKSINARILNTERIYGKESQIVQRIYETLERAYGEEGVTRFKKVKAPEKLSFSRELQIESAYNQINLSKYTSAAGRASIRDKWTSTFVQNHAGWSDQQIGRAMDVFTNSMNWEKIRELVGEYGSDVVLEMITHNGDEGDIEKLDEFIDAYLNNTDYSEQHSNITKEIMDFMMQDAEGKEIFIEVLKLI